MAAKDQLRNRPGLVERSGDAAASEAPAATGDAAARARAYLDLWERHLVYAAVRSRFGPVRAPGGPEAPPRA